MAALLLLAVALGLDNLAAAIGFGVAGLVQARRELGHPGHEAGERAQPPQRSSVQPIGRLLLAGLVLSGDNLAAGFALGAYQVGIAAAAVVFGAVSVVMSLAGLELGARIGTAAGERSELIACVLLIVVGAVIAAGVL